MPIICEPEHRMSIDLAHWWHRLVAAIVRFFASDSWRRTWRSFAQAFVGVLVLSFSVEQIPDPATVLEVLVAAGWAGVIAVVVLVHNELEDHVPSVDTRQARRRDGE